LHNWRGKRGSMKRPLTPKQEAFCLAYIETGNASESYISTYGMPVDAGDRYYVYALVVADTDEIIYIGKGKGDRAKQHVTAAKNGRISNAPKHQAIMAAYERGSSILEMIIESNLDEPAALQFEKYLIKALKDQLTNIANGSRHNRDICAEKAKYWLSRMKPFNTWLATMPNKVWVEVMKRDIKIASEFYEDSVNAWKMIIRETDGAV
jgi:hypothetical protein